MHILKYAIKLKKKNKKACQSLNYNDFIFYVFYQSVNTGESLTNCTEPEPFFMDFTKA